LALEALLSLSVVSDERGAEWAFSLNRREEIIENFASKEGSSKKSSYERYGVHPA